MKKNIFYSVLVILFCTSMQGAKIKYDGILEKILSGNSMEKLLEGFNYNETMRPAPTKTKVSEDCHNIMLYKIGDKDVIPVAIYYCEVYKLLVNLIARGMYDAYVMNDDCSTASLTTYFTPNILSAYEKITEIYVKIPAHVRCILHDIDYGIKMSKTVDGYNSGYSLNDVYQVVSLLIGKNRCACKDYENRAFCERALFENITIPTSDCCLEKFGMKSLAPLWDKAAKLRRKLGFIFNLSTFMPLLIDSILAEYPKIQANYLLFSSDMVFADPSIRLVKRIAEIKLCLEKIKNVEEKNRIEAIIDSVFKKLPALQDGYHAQQYEDEKHQIHVLPLVTLYNFLNTGHITLLHLSSILTKLRLRVKKLSQDNVPEAKKACVELKRCIKHISIFLKVVSKLPKEVKTVNVANSKSKKLVVSEAKENATFISEQKIDSTYGSLIYDPILTPPLPSFEKNEARKAMKAFVESIELRWRHNAGFDANKKSAENFQIQFKKKKGPKESTFHLAVELLGYIFGDYDWCVGPDGDIYVKRQLFEGNDLLTILSSSPVSATSTLGGEQNALYKNIVHDIAASENQKIEKNDLVSDVLRLADKHDHKVFVLSDGTTLSPALVEALGYQPGELDGYHVLLCPVVIVKSNYVELVLAAFRKMEDLAMGPVMDVLAQVVPPAGLVMGLLYVLVPHAKMTGAKIESEADKFTVGEAGFCWYSQKGLTKCTSIKDVIEDDSQNSMQGVESALVEKYFKNICLLSPSEKGELIGYIRDSWKLKILFAIHESFHWNAVLKKRESDLVAPYFDDLFELYQSLTQKCGVMSSKVSELVNNFDDDEKSHTAYTTRDIMNLMLVYSTDKELLMKIVGSEKQLEEFFFPVGQSRTLENSEKEMNLRLHMFKRSFGLKGGHELFKTGDYLLAESSKFPPMKGMYAQIFLALLKHKFIRNYPKFLFGLLGEDGGKFFQNMTEPWLWQNRLFDMSKGKLPFIPKEKHKDVRTKVYELRGVLNSLSANFKKKTSLYGDGFLAYFYNDLDVNSQFYRTMLDMAGGTGGYGDPMHYCNLYRTCRLVSTNGEAGAPKLRDSATEFFCNFVGQHKKKDGKKLMEPFLEGFAKHNDGYQIIEKK